MNVKPEWANPRWGDWANFPDPIPEEQICRTVNAEVVIVGAGIAGVTAALRAAQNGAKVAVVEKTGKWNARGGNLGVPESWFMRSKGIELDKEAFAREWVKRCGTRCDERVLWLYVNHAGEAMDWLLDMMTKDDLTRPIIQGAIYHGDTYRELPGSHRFFDGPYARKGARAGATDCVGEMYRLSLELGVEYFFNCPGEQLIKENGRVTGLLAKGEDGYVRFLAEKGVILATGDIGGNREMCEDLAPDANRCCVNVYTPVGANTGDGHRMGLWAGGFFDADHLPTMIHPQFPCGRSYCFLFVNRKGERFMNEDTWIQGKCQQILYQNQSTAWSIIDGDWETKVPASIPYGGGIFWDQDNELGSEWDVEFDRQVLERGRRSGALVEADTLEELAEKMEIPADTFVATVKRYNELCRQGKDTDLGKRKELLIPIEKPPFFGLKYGATLLVVVGGLRVNARLQVIDTELDPIPGLYAIGNVGGGRYGVDYPLVVPGNSHGTALTFGYMAGEFITGKQ